MAQYNENLQRLVGFVRSVKPTADPAVITGWINQTIRTVIDRRPYWSALLRQGIIPIPASYSTGTVSLTSGSATVAGSGTSWPTTDLVNTTVSAAITSPGVYSVTPSSMSGITEDSLLYVDAGGTPEIISVRSTTGTTFTAEFSYAHSGSFTITASSYAGRQLRISSSYPAFTILAVTSSTSLTLENSWGGADLSGTSYSIVKKYYTIDPDIKDILLCVDQSQPAALNIHISQAYMNQIDPQRTASGDPYILADYLPSRGGNMQYEIYPTQTTAGQLDCIYALQWPELRRPGDQAPWFINPKLWIDGALALALRTRSQSDDPFYDPKAGMQYQRDFEAGVIEAVNADNSKALQAMESFSKHLHPGGDWAQSHAVSVGGYGCNDEDW